MVSIFTCEKWKQILRVQIRRHFYEPKIVAYVNSRCYILLHPALGSTPTQIIQRRAEPLGFFAF
ncbi:hypothetical protein R69658_04317 [Paraburkholderia aspalathi]|uniref:Transposase n=1 Tax=Paraburkholderia aspalathi TaxID=1324617 RepID=A0ABM8S3T1_9BURK|nr:hypothetical protein R69658_04317 [Paraburkholderia aspalathi]